MQLTSLAAGPLSSEVTCPVGTKASDSESLLFEGDTTRYSLLFSSVFSGGDALFCRFWYSILHGSVGDGEDTSSHSRSGTLSSRIHDGKRERKFNKDQNSILFHSVFPRFVNVYDRNRIDLMLPRTASLAGPSSFQLKRWFQKSKYEH